MNILHIIDHLGTGGAQVLALGACRGRAGYYCYALRKVSREQSPDAPNIFMRDSLARADLGSLREIRNLIKQYQINVLHCHLAKAAFIGYLVKKLYFPTIKLIIHEEGRIFTGNLLYTLFLRITQSSVDRFIAVSCAAQKELIERVGITPEHITVIYPGADLDNIARVPEGFDCDDERKNIGVGPQDFLVGFAARLVERKGWQVFVEMIPQVLEKVSHCKFVIVGDGRDRDKLLRRIDDLQLRDAVICLGRLNDLHCFYHYIDCLVIPSYFEPFPVTLIQAQAARVPVVASDVGGQNELIRHEENGLLFSSQDAAACADRVVRLAGKKLLREQLTEKAIECLHAFSKEHFLDALDKVYEEVA